MPGAPTTATRIFVTPLPALPYSWEVSVRAVCPGCGGRAGLEAGPGGEGLRIHCQACGHDRQHPEALADAFEALLRQAACAGPGPGEPLAGLSRPG